MHQQLEENALASHAITPIYWYTTDRWVVGRGTYDFSLDYETFKEKCIVSYGLLTQQEKDPYIKLANTYKKILASEHYSNIDSEDVDAERSNHSLDKNDVIECNECDFGNNPRLPIGQLICICQEVCLSNSDDVLICCIKCDLWFHAKCIKLTLKDALIISKNNLTWTCHICFASEQAEFIVCHN